MRMKGFLMLSRKKGESVMVGHGMQLVVLGISGHRVRLGFRGDQNVRVLRQEIYDRLYADPGDAAAEDAARRLDEQTVLEAINDPEGGGEPDSQPRKGGRTSD